MGIRKRMRSRVKSIAAQGGIPALRRARNNPVDPKGLETRREIWADEVDRRIVKQNAWEERMR